MARVEVYPDRVVIELTAAERVLALRQRRQIVLPRDLIASALITEDPWVWLTGVRAPGTYVPGKVAIGTWRGEGGKDFVLVRSGKPAIVLNFEGDADSADLTDEHDRFARVILSTSHAAEMIRALRLDGDAGVVTIDQ